MPSNLSSVNTQGATLKHPLAGVKLFQDYTASCTFLYKLPVSALLQLEAKHLRKTLLSVEPHGDMAHPFPAPVGWLTVQTNAFTLLSQIQTSGYEMYSKPQYPVGVHWTLAADAPF